MKTFRVWLPLFCALLAVAGAARAGVAPYWQLGQNLQLYRRELHFDKGMRTVRGIRAFGDDILWAKVSLAANAFINGNHRLSGPGDLVPSFSTCLGTCALGLLYRVRNSIVRDRRLYAEPSEGTAPRPRVTKQKEAECR